MLALAVAFGLGCVLGALGRWIWIIERPRQRRALPSATARALRRDRRARRLEVRTALAFDEGVHDEQ